MLHEVIPIMDLLNDELKKIVNNASQPSVIRKAVQRAITVLDKYYTLTDDSIMWKTAMRASLPHYNSSKLIYRLVLHPKYRRAWFVKAQ